MPRDQVKKQTRKQVNSDAPLIIATPALRQNQARWLKSLGSERRLSAATLEAYDRDLDQFFFLPHPAYG